MLLFSMFLIVLTLVTFFYGISQIEKSTQKRIREEIALKSTIESLMKSKDVDGLRIFATINRLAIEKMDNRMNEKIFEFIDDVTIERHDKNVRRQ